MSKDYLAELQWRGLLHDYVQGLEEELQKGVVRAYIGFDPTADSLHAGNLLAIMLLVHFQNAGHQPIVVVGGATGKVGDPSGKNTERTLLSDEVLQQNVTAIQKQLAQFLDFSSTKNPAILLNNIDWTRDISFLDFMRDIGKYIMVNYMMAKDSVKNRLQSTQGLSFTEFTYQLLQGFDFYYLFENYNCKLQMGGSDQWGNITTGIELIHKKNASKAYALVAPLLTKSDGTKFGKSESGAIWLDAKKTSPYHFYQFWLGASDEDAMRWIKIFTLLERPMIENLIAEHAAAPHLRVLQKTLAADITTRVHGAAALAMAQKATQILFGESTFAMLQSLDTDTFSAVFEGVGRFAINAADLQQGLSLSAAFVNSGFCASNSELKRELTAGALFVNKEKVIEGQMLTAKDVVADKYIVLQRGKKKYFLLYLS